MSSFGESDYDSDDDKEVEAEDDVLADLSAVPSPYGVRPTLGVAAAAAQSRGSLLADEDDSSDQDDELLDLSESSSGGKVNFSGLTKTIQQDIQAAAAPTSLKRTASGKSSTGSNRSLGSAKAASSTTEASLRSTSDRRSALKSLKTITSGRSLSSSHSGQNSPQARKKVISGRRTASARQRQSPNAATSTTTTNPSSSNPRAAIFASKLAKRSTALKTRLSLHSSTHMEDSGLHREEMNHQQKMRRYKVGDYVLVSNLQSKWANLVNKHGFPPGEGETPEERRGPYEFVLAKVKKVHFEEIAAYYTVTRTDTGVDQRADGKYMEPLRTHRGEIAALRAATSGSAKSGEDNELGDIDEHGADGGVYGESKLMHCLQLVCFTILIPFLWLYDCFYFIGARYVMPCWRRALLSLKRQARLFLNGLAPYQCRITLTCVNFIVVCSIWYMFIDQLRLAFFPVSADRTVAAINLGVWIVLVLELIFEVFIRPDGYRGLLITDKAYAPTTVRYINAFHLIVEFISLLIFIPEFYCILASTQCDERLPFSFYNAALIGVIGPTKKEMFYGHAFFALVRLRVFGLVRHWRNMWITNTFINMKWKANQKGMLSSFVPYRSSRVSHERKSLLAKRLDPEIVEQKKRDAALTNASTIGTALMATNSYRALTLLWIIIGLFPLITTLLPKLINDTASAMTRQLQGTNLVASNNATETCQYLRQSVWSWVVGITDPDFHKHPSPYLLTLDIEPRTRCNFEGVILTQSLCSGLLNLVEQNSDIERRDVIEEVCEFWDLLTGNESSETEIANAFGIRTGSVLLYELSQPGNFTYVGNDGVISNTTERYSVASSFDATYTVSSAAAGSVILQFCLLILVLGGLSVLRRDAEVLVLGPIRRMLKTVARYAKNPLAQAKLRSRSSSRKHSGRFRASDRSGVSDNEDDEDDWNSDTSFDEDGGLEDDGEALGSYETEQLITAVNKITDLLRKCWGVAGANIISTNLATREGLLTEVFHPTVPGKSVYALFGFVAINRFDHALRQLGGDVMILINDVANVLHGEVFRWGFGDSGQCNKNLGSAFLMVFRIGRVEDVIEKLQQATDVVFSTGTTKSSHASTPGKRRHHRQSSTGSGSAQHSIRSQASSGSSHKSSRVTPASVTVARSAARSVQRKLSRRSSSARAMSLNLQSLPGISAFTDRAVIGMLKSFAGIYRDNKIRDWNNDFRLGLGVGAFTVSMIFGMDAGWAVEGPVGSEYKIDATYLSPHVNMASRMMSACRQYNVSILLSQAVEELMSDVARSKLRHIDTVTVKGSSVRQNIYTYDARYKGVDFFLYSRPDDQADVDADRYSPQTWINDQDLRAMRQHITDEFLEEFNSGLKAYLAGDWPKAIKRLERANEIMVETALEDGYLEDEFEALHELAGEDARAAEEELKRENGDGPSLYLLNFMKQQGGVAPPDWDGWHPLMSK